MADEADIHEVRYGVSWEEFERFLESKGDDVVPRVAYLDGVLELVTPSKGHEQHGSWIGRLVDVYALNAGIDLSAFGSWTLKDKLRRAGVEPDECFILGENHEDFELPHLVIEIQWSRSAIRKLEIYKRLGIGEVWFWKRKNVIDVYVMQGDEFVQAERSACLPGLDLEQLCSFLGSASMTRAMREYRDALEKK